jgi:hypothetical protein
MKAPKLEDERLTFNVQVLEENLADADGPASLFIDTADYMLRPPNSLRSQSNPISNPCAVLGA